jgi:serine/threonine protein kinase
VNGSGTDPEQGNSNNPQIVLDNEVDDYHDAGTVASIRHGDLKPENILGFSDETMDLGILRLADMSLTKRHVVATQLRTKGTNTRWSIRRYEAPEALSIDNVRSRLYDVWSMGCITLVFIIWILYGKGELKKLYSQIEGLSQQL